MCLLNTIVRGVEAAQDEEAAEAAEEQKGGDSSEVFQRDEQGVRSLTTSSKGSSFFPLDSALQQRFAQSNSRALKAAQAVLHAHNVSERDPVMLQSRCELCQSHDPKSYSVVSTQAISGHAHMIPDFDAPVGKSWYWWDVIY